MGVLYLKISFSKSEEHSVYFNIQCIRLVFELNRSTKWLTYYSLLLLLHYLRGNVEYILDEFLRS